MARVVPSDQIEDVTGAYRSSSRHIARAVSRENTIYVMHSRICREYYIDLRTCPYSQAIDKGIDEGLWSEHMDLPMYVRVIDGQLVPDRPVSELHYTHQEKKRVRENREQKSERP